MPSVTYLTLEAAQEGQASYAHVHEICNGLNHLGWRINLFKPSYSKDKQLPNPWKRLWEFIKIQAKICCQIKADNTDILYIRSHFAALPVSFIARIKRISVIQEVNGPYDDLFIAWPWTAKFKWFFKWLIRTQLYMADAIITVTPQLTEWVINESGNNSVYVIPNGANIRLFHPNAISSIKVDKPYVVFFGSMAVWQGIDVILEAVDEPDWPPELTMVFFGDGIERPKVEKAANENPRIEYFGILPYLEVPGIIAGSICSLSPKNNKGDRTNTGLAPMKVVETLACGIPVIVTDFPGMSDMIRDNNCGLVIPPDDPKALVQAISHILYNPKESEIMRLNARQLAERELSWDKRAKDTERIMFALIEGRIKEKTTREK